MFGDVAIRCFLLCMTFLVAGPALADEGAALTNRQTDAPASPPIESQVIQPGQVEGKQAEPGEQAAVSSDEVVALDDLKQRVAARWAAMIDKNYHRAYEYCSPAYRALFTAKQFASKFGSAKLNWQRIDIVSVKRENDEGAKVNIRIFAEVFPPDTEKSVPVASVFGESWIRSGGEWWYVPGI